MKQQRANSGWPHANFGIGTFLRPTLLACSLLMANASLNAQPKAAGDLNRVNALLAKMTLPEKVALIRGDQESPENDQGQAGFLSGVARLGVASLRFADGPPGILTRQPSAALVSTMGLAATFSRDAARENGKVIGMEAKRLGVDVALEPFVNVMRDTTVRRSWNTYGEDPLVNGIMGAEVVRGIQDEGVMAQAKHFIAYDSTGYDVTVDEQTLHEVYLEPFDEVIKAGVSSIMCAYNKINGDFACGNSSLLNNTLRDEMGFKGFVTSDWGGVHSNQYLKAGLDMEMPGRLRNGSPWLTIMRSYFDIDPAPVAPMRLDMSVLAKVFARSVPEEDPTPGAARPQSPKQMAGQFPDDLAPRNLYSGLQDHVLSMQDVDTAARRVLLEMDRFGYLDRQGNQPTGATVDPEIARINQHTSELSATLLKNEGAVLPLKGEDLKSVVLIGPGAAQTVALGINAEHALGFPERQTGAYAALEKYAGQHVANAKISLAIANDMTGTPVPASALSHSGAPGLSRLHDGKVEGVDAMLNFTKRNGNPLPAGTFRTWKGDINIPSDGTYGIYLQMLGANANICIDGKPLAHTSSVVGAGHGDTVQAGQDNLLPTTDGLNNVRRDVALTAGRHVIEISTESDTSGAPVQIRLSWSTPEKRKANLDAAVEAARTAKVAVVFAWGRNVPLFGLPGGQNELIERVAAVNPRTVVVLNTSAPVAMPWLDRVKAVLQMWWTGDEGGVATANILSGVVSPAGRLPFTWGMKLEDYPATDPRHPERGQRLDGVVTYSEGLDVGYRWFEREGIKPLYPFGYGLSYSTFSYSGLKVQPSVDGGAAVSFTLRNTGKVTSDEVPQVYLSAPNKVPQGAQFSVKALAGYDRVTLRPGESRLVTIQLPVRRFQYWSSTAREWVTARAGRALQVGPNSRDLPLRTQLKN